VIDMSQTASDTGTVVPAHDDLMNTILGLLYDKLTGGDGDVVAERRRFFAWATPGIPISDDQFDFMGGLIGDTEAESARRFALAADFAALVDFKPDPTGVLTAGDQQAVISARRGTLSSEWERILRLSHVADSPLSDEEQANLERLEDLLTTTRTEKDVITGEEREITDDGTLVKLYNEKFAAFEAAALEFNSARIDALTGTTPGAAARFAINGPILARRVEAARDDWAAVGKRDEVDRIRAHIAQVTGRSMVLHKQRMIERFERSKLTDANSGVEFHYTALSPANILGAGGWTTFELTSADSNTTSSSRTNKWSAGGKLPLGGFSIGGKAGGERSEITSSLDMRNFSLKFEMAQAVIRRPGMDNTAWLESTGWRFPAGETLLTDGEEPPEGTLIAYPETMVLVRNIELKFDELKNSSSEIHKKFNAGGGLGWGVFKLSGDYGRESREKVVESHADGQAIRVNGTQIAGYGCYVLPGPSPNPNPEIPADRWVPKLPPVTDEV
jgi:hypothetical protein